MPLLGSELGCTSWRCLIGNDGFVVGHDLLLNQNVLAKALAFSAVLLRDAESPIDIKTGVFLSLHSGNEIKGDEAESG